MTETLITHLPAPGSVRPGYVGCAIPGVEAKLSDEQELLIRSPMNMLGYYKHPESTQASFTADGFFRTGDLARIEPDGQLKIIGRVKEQFKTSKGKYVMPTPIESQLLAHPVVDACCLMGAGMPRPFAVVLLAEETRKATTARLTERATVEQTLLDLMNTVNTQLDPHEQLSFVAVAAGTLDGRQRIHHAHAQNQAQRSGNPLSALRRRLAEAESPDRVGIAVNRGPALTIA